MDKSASIFEALIEQADQVVSAVPMSAAHMALAERYCQIRNAEAELRDTCSALEANKTGDRAADRKIGAQIRRFEKDLRALDAERRRVRSEISTHRAERGQRAAQELLQIRAALASHICDAIEKLNVAADAAERIDGILRAAGAQPTEMAPFFVVARDAGERRIIEKAAAVPVPVSAPPPPFELSWIQQVLFAAVGNGMSPELVGQSIDPRVAGALDQWSRPNEGLTQ